MAKLDVAPTKSSYLTLKKNLEFAQQGFDLLEQKRTILTIELMGQLEAVRQVEKELGPSLKRAYEGLREASLENGSDRLERLSTGARATGHDVSLEGRPLMGIQLPSLEFDLKPLPAQFSGLDSSASVDEVSRSFLEALRHVARLAQLQTLVIRLARELKKTQRRVNALEKNFIPDYKETIHYIDEALDERERESIVIMKMIKSRLAGQSQQ